ncbi:MAG TPA: FAD-dependent oxidoreductase [Gemmatimonadaceae bacterium]|nr:FAD-dependent oxidoreductase [Gemmatimonadaceae bacterium]
MTKPVILTVDDDLEVLAAIERDLRAKYAGEFRVLKASSGQSALDAVRELKKRGAPVALFLVDQRMPGMTGVELLRELRTLYPEARKVLLTAYADTEAAIASINDVGLDHYLMKPWAPPATRLYPVLDDLLSEWTASVRLPFEGIRVIGSPWSRASYTTKEFLSRNHVPYQWTDIDQDDAAREMVRAAAGGTSLLPVVFFPDGSHLVAPTTLELAAKAGLRTQAERPFYDLIIIGGGPAGLANAVYAGSEGLRTVLVEASAPGGQAGTSSRIENYLGFPNGITGADLAQRAVAQARRFGAEILTAREVVGIRRADPYRFVKLADGTELSSYAVVISTGMQVRRLDVPGVDELTGAGVYYGAAMTEGATYRGRDVCIVGAANSAGQGAMFFSRTARKVTLLVHGEGIEKKMSDYLVARIKATDNIEVIAGVDVVRVEGTDHLERVILRDAAGAERAIAQAAMFIFIGATPRTEMFAGALARDDAGFILTGPDLPRRNGRVEGWTLDRDPFLFETSIPGVFAAGDVRAGANRRVAAAVGEGSAAIYTVHRYLETV